MRKGRVLYVTQWFQPEPAFKGVDFAAALSDAGFEVEVLTGFPNYPGGRLYPGYRLRPHARETMDGVTIHRVWLYPSHSRSAWGRVLNYVSFFFSVLMFGLFNGHRYDAVYVYHPPLTPALATMLFTRIWRIPFLVEIQDLWPDSLIASNMVPQSLAGLMRIAGKMVYERAAKVIAQSQGMAKRLEIYGTPKQALCVLYNWATYSAAEGCSDPMPVFPDAHVGDFKIVYGGNLGQAQALDSVIEATVLAHLKDPRVKLHLFGGGIERTSLAKQANGSGCVYLHPPVSRKEMDRIFDQSDALILQLKDESLFQITIPSKLQHYLACGKPVIAGLAGEAAQIARVSGAALAVPPQDVQACAAAMLTLAAMSEADRYAMGQSGRTYYAQHLGFDRAITQTVKLLEDAMHPRVGAAPDQVES